LNQTEGGEVKEGFMKAIIGGAAGVAALGGALLLANTRPTPTAAQASSPATTVASTSANAPNGPMYVDCGEGRMALVKPVAAGQSYSQIECTTAPAAMAPQAWGPQANSLVPVGAYQYQQFQEQPQVVVRDRVVYRDQPVARSSSRAVRRTASYEPVRTTTYEQPKKGRSWKKSALIIGGGAAGGAGVGALLGGKSGAKKGAVVGGVGGLVYDLATRNK
jgi:hypothetical protein